MKLVNSRRLKWQLNGFFVGQGIQQLGIAISCLVTFAMAYAQSDLKAAPTRLTLQVTVDPLRGQCRRLDASDPIPLRSVSLHRTFHDDFDEHPLSSGKWVPHYAGGAAWPEARYWGGDGSDFERKTAYNGEQQIYVDPRYGGRATAPLGLDPFKIQDGVLSIMASRTPLAMSPLLFDNPYGSGAAHEPKLIFAKVWIFRKFVQRSQSEPAFGRLFGFSRITMVGRPKLM